jgi:hypothetical protein
MPIAGNISLIVDLLVCAGCGAELSLLRAALQTRQLLRHVTASPRVTGGLGSVTLARSSLDDFDLERRCLGLGSGGESFDGVGAAWPGDEQALVGAHFHFHLSVLGSGPGRQPK